MQLNEAVKEAINILSEIDVGNMTPMAEEAWKSAIKILEDSLQLMKQQQRPVAWIDVKPNPTYRPLTYEAIYEWWRSENGLEDYSMTKFFDFLEIVRSVEQRIELNNKHA